MLFNLGLTADAAAAHENDVVAHQSESRPARHSSPSNISFALPSLGLANNRNGWHKAAQAELSRKGSRGAMSRDAEEPGSSDGEHSTVGPALVRPQIARAQSVRKQSSRPKTSYQLAHPASHARHRRLNFRPKLVLQLQRLSQTPRPLPVLDVLPSTVYLPRLARKFPTIFRGKKGLGPNDLIVVTSDLYERTGGDIADKYLSSDDENGEHREVVATICQLLREDALAKGKAEICLNHGPVWEATPLTNGSYEFVAETDRGVQILRWVLRGGKNRRVSAPPGSSLQEESRRFTFSVIDPTTRRHPVIATMTRNHLEVFDEYSMPTSGFASPTSGMSVISDSSELDTPLDRPLDRRVIVTDDNLRTLIIITSIWVAFREGWSHNFNYKDTALALNPKSLCSSRQTSPTATKAENNPLPSNKEVFPDGPYSSPKHRMSGSHALPSRSTTPSDRTFAYGSLSKRSNSTGAAFIERSNRRASSATLRPSRHSLLSNPREAAPIGVSEVNALQEEPGSRTTRSHPKRPDFENERDFVAPSRKPGIQNGTRKLDASNEKAAKSLNRNAEPAPTKGKRRHRFSNIFDFLTRKSGAH
ncbi:uncharacterized protein LDX57_005911 [Aspergillus melleus]|uniref:uncharacterized protein n=1 Tax=Aspergillus melleus TaxID=138277 RepID=UPI001E8DA9C5|nr:uncharacterized protein LDX57_005911 [Aspergillus melleus]KAH8428208.1 hypothetical protein LDX57_005911 [Aspergillus melleus]